jgi:hypothetical protein
MQDFITPPWTAKMDTLFALSLGQGQQLYSCPVHVQTHPRPGGYYESCHPTSTKAVFKSLGVFV